MIADSTITDIAGDRIYYTLARQGDSKPYITIQRVSMQSGLTLDGVDTLRRISYQIDCYAGTFSEVLSLSTAVRGLLDGFSGILSGTRVQFVAMENEQDLSEIENDIASRRISLDFLFIAHEG